MPYKYHNENPNGYHIPDCVVRAIVTATGLSYFDVIEHLHYNGMMFECDDLSVRCYEKLLDYDFGFPHFIGNGYTAEQISTSFPNDTVILRMKGHLSVSACGIIHDIWNCEDEPVTDFWVVI